MTFTTFNMLAGVAGFAQLVSSLVLTDVYRLATSKYCLHAPGTLTAGVQVQAIVCHAGRTDLILALELLEGRTQPQDPGFLHSQADPSFCMQDSTDKVTWETCDIKKTAQAWEEIQVDPKQVRYRSMSSGNCTSPALPQNDFSLLNSTAVANASPPVYPMLLKPCAEAITYTFISPENLGAMFPLPAPTGAPTTPPSPTPSVPVQVPGEARPQNGDCHYVYSLPNMGLGLYWTYQASDNGTYTLARASLPSKMSMILNPFSILRDTLRLSAYSTRPIPSDFGWEPDAYPYPKHRMSVWR
ncbi:uncharacterized protein SPPG_04881 [Spizellomyces punctatus DAOM BR117]|uniref:Uncharacterized protein n=1 Tax=Spizellomyces punctatus (strain DAOM BR117) TaxID=645134 RepID=A0A0L0HES2_SPIPD|nr:uncharacterized protein SPPG_04881 [Spizellomyces punctatus DAOM BR117]KNC99484.1 hypothetical protein SPPG_04881 [Spizellomyces punctatus DAOM BR117]|eukprot:XP_016607524.1 hypothetical protein SPPG_04881 [Spizellomyces punctatus DAOM BR117]